MITGGFTVNGGTETETSEIFSDGGWFEGPNLPNKRQNHCQVNLDGDIYIIGGRSGESSVSTVYKITESNMVSGEWMKVADMSEVREDHCCVSHQVFVNFFQLTVLK